jgi:parallel beta-helix repeat protein
MSSSTSKTQFVSRLIRRAMLAAAPTLVLAICASPAAAQGCDKVASPSGDDAAAGTDSAPLRTAQALADSLAPGETGCLHAGTYFEDLRVNHGGNAGAPIVIQSYPGERARVVGRLYVPRGSDYVTVANLDLDGTNLQGTNADDLPSPTVDSAYATFQGDDVTNDHTNICFNLGNSSYGRAEHTLIQGDRIHDCGVLPAQNHHHGIYVSNADDTQILNNVIYDNADRGIQLYPDAQRTTIKGNVIDGNGEGIIFSGDGGVSSNDNVVENNVITNSTLRNNVESYYPDGNPIGSGNLVQDNCIYGGARDSGDGAIGDGVGYSVSATIHANPQYANRAGKDFQLAPTSPCAALLAGAVLPTSGSRPTTSTTAPPRHGRRGGARVSLKTRRLRRGKIAVHGTVHYGAVLRAAGASRAVIQVLRGGHWSVVAKTAVIRGHFSLVLRHLNARRVRLRVVVPSVGRSPAVTVSLG